MLSGYQINCVVKKIIPLLAGWSIKDALDALEYAREHICESTNVRQVTDPSQVTKVDEEIMLNGFLGDSFNKIANKA